MRRIIPASFSRLAVWLRNTSIIGPLIFFFCLAAMIWFFSALLPLQGGTAAGNRIFTVKTGDGFWSIASRLESEGLTRSRWAFAIFSSITGRAFSLKSGVYHFNSHLSAPVILDILVAGRNREVTVTIPEGASLYEIDALLGERDVLRAGALLAFVASSSGTLEGRLFPDTYNFFIQSEAEEVTQKFLGNFAAKAEPFLNQEPAHREANLILASLIEKEVPDFEDRRVVAGILKKRLAAGVPLQVDASICYVKQLLRQAAGDCLPITGADLQINSPYNTYLAKGLPLGPIGNPGLAAIRAVLEPTSSSYWFYLSDPATKKTIFSKTLEEHNKNRARYLGSWANSQQSQPEE